MFLREIFLPQNIAFWVRFIRFVLINGSLSYVTRSGNIGLIHIFVYFEKYEFEILNALFFSCGTILSRQIYYINSAVI